ncbi:IDEAL domain-containing protein [Ectobacillus ponti]|uniref:IDEAL domain-containing protein n=1 Tax=Ectobacillus ponti TaxID=2961894 RepID=A0AA41XD04_9BACI|nr:IDEAL domain-containing protein [Ectobacillus ponti]
MKKDLLNTPKQSELDAMYSLFAQLVLDEAIHSFRKKQLQEKIDQSLAAGDKSTFLRLSKEYKQIS